MQDRYNAARKDKNLVSPLIISTAAAIGEKKLKLMLSEQAVFLRTNTDFKEHPRTSHQAVPSA